VSEKVNSLSHWAGKGCEGSAVFMVMPKVLSRKGMAFTLLSLSIVQVFLPPSHHVVVNKTLDQENYEREAVTRAWRP
jgi:hypothetical protein